MKKLVIFLLIFIATVLTFVRPTFSTLAVVAIVLSIASTIIPAAALLAVKKEKIR